MKKSHCTQSPSWAFFHARWIIYTINLITTFQFCAWSCCPFGHFNIILLRVNFLPFRTSIQTVSPPTHQDLVTCHLSPVNEFLCDLVKWHFFFLGHRNDTALKSLPGEGAPEIGQGLGFIRKWLAKTEDEPPHRWATTSKPWTSYLCKTHLFK